MTVKQKSLHSALPVWECINVSGALCASCIVLSGSGAFGQTMPKGPGDQAATMRLVGGISTNGTYNAGIDVVMTPGSHTYWKTPGDAGVPPVFAFDGSENVAKADVLFPAPSRITEDGLDAFGYADKVVFPVVVTPLDASKPSILHLVMMYAVCNKICIPAHGDAMLTLAPTGGETNGASVAAALAEVPAPIPAAERGNLTVTPIKGPKPAWTIAWMGAFPVKDVFADAPEGYAFDTRKTGASTWTLTVAQSVGSVKGALVPVSLTLSRDGGVGGVVATEKLDAGPATQ